MHPCPLHVVPVLWYFISNILEYGQRVFPRAIDVNITKFSEHAP